MSAFSAREAEHSGEASAIQSTLHHACAPDRMRVRDHYACDRLMNAVVPVTAGLLTRVVVHQARRSLSRPLVILGAIALVHMLSARSNALGRVRVALLRVLNALRCVVIFN